MPDKKKIVKDELNIDEHDNKKGTCFVIMPISDCEGYDKGHYTRVYEHLFKPAIEEAGYSADRADVQSANNIMLGIIKSITQAEMVLCDLSSTNPNVLYELGLRNAFEKPVILVKDEKTKHIFDISTMRYHEYHSSLRADYVEKNIEIISQALRNYQEDKMSYSLMQQANVENAPLPSPTPVDSSTMQILSSLDMIAHRIRNIERRDRFYSTSRLSNERYGIDNLSFEDILNSKLYTKEGEYVGKVVDIGGKDFIVLGENNEPRKFPLSKIHEFQIIK